MCMSDHKLYFDHTFIVKYHHFYVGSYIGLNWSLASLKILSPPVSD